MVAQDELRRRIRAAMALAGISSWEELAEVTPFSRSLLKDLGTQRALVAEHHLRQIAASCSVPYAWFTVPDLAATVAGAEDASLGERVEAIERKIDASRGRPDFIATLPDGSTIVAEVKATAASGDTAMALEQATAYLVSRIAEIEARVDAQGRAPVDQIRDATRDAIDASRAVKEVASVSAGGVRREPEPVDQAHGEEDASQESARAASSRTPRAQR